MDSIYNLRRTSMVDIKLLLKDLEISLEIMSTVDFKKSMF